MQKKISSIPFSGTPEQEAKLKEVIAKNIDDPGAVMPVLQEAQEIYGYLPIEVQKMVAEGLGVPLEEVYGVSTFYSQFALSPKGKYNISVCLGTACYVKGSGDILNKLSEMLGIEAEECTPDGKFSLTACRCIGACGLAPVLTVNDEVYGRLTVADVPGILEKYKDIPFPGNRALPSFTNQAMNRSIKDLCQLAGIDEPIRITTFKGNVRKDVIHPKWELVGTHTGRRTFIVNALSLGIPPDVVMKWTGHSDYKSMKPYIDIVDSIKAQSMAKFNDLL